MLETGSVNGTGGVSSTCFLGNGHQLLIGLTSPVVSLWDTESESVVRNYVVRKGNDVLHVHVHYTSTILHVPKEL